MPVANSQDLNRIGIFLPQGYRGGGLRFTKKLCEMVLYLTREQGTQVVLSVVKGDYNVETEFELLANDPRFSVRETVWKKASAKNLIALELIGHDLPSGLSEKFLYPDDGGHDFLDCHAWLIVSDRTMTPIAPFRPYAIFPLDFLQRYVPEIFGSADDYLWDRYLDSMQRNLRNANLVLCTTPQTAADAISFGGVTANKVKTMLPFLEDYSSSRFSPSMDNDKELCEITETPYFLWVTNPYQHKNHLTAIDALKTYYSRLGGKLRCVVCGIDTQYMRVDGELHSEYAESVMEKLNRLLPGDDQVLVCGEQTEEGYWQLIRNAQFVWHNVIADNGTYAVMEAAMVNVPSLSSNYPQIRFFDELFGLNLIYFPANDAGKTAAALKDMEGQVSQSKALPSISFPLDYKRRLDEAMRSVLNDLHEAAAQCRN